MLYFLKKIKKNTCRYHYFTPVHQTSWWYDLQFLDIECDRQKVVLMSHFLPFYLPLKPPKIIILHKCIKNHDNMLYCSWNMACDRCNFYFLFWAIFLPFLTPDSLKYQDFKKIIKKKPPGDIIILQMCTKIHDQMTKKSYLVLAFLVSYLLLKCVRQLHHWLNYLIHLS